MLLISAIVPVIQEADDLVTADVHKQSTYSHIAVDLHLLCEQRVAESIVRIVLTGIVLIDDGESYQI